MNLEEWYEADPGHHEIVDDDGYPTDEVLELIPRFTGTRRELVEDILTPIFDRFGIVKIIDTTDDLSRAAKNVRLATGGWSGCESAISALERSYFWFRYWNASRRGGGYTFTVPTGDWEEPMPDFSMLLAPATPKCSCGQPRVRA